MTDFYEYIARSRRMALPDSQTMLTMAGVGLDVPNEEETQRLLNREKKRQPTGGKAHRMINRLDGQPAQPAKDTGDHEVHGHLALRSGLITL